MIDQNEIQNIVREVLGELKQGTAPAAVQASRPAPQPAAQSASKSPARASGNGGSGNGAKIHDYMGEFPHVMNQRKQASNTTGVFDNVNDAVNASELAFEELSRMSLAERVKLIEAVRECALANKRDFAERTQAETGIGRVEHKMAKFELVAGKTPGIEILQPACFTGDRGLTVDEVAPYGVIGAITPVTHPLPTMMNNAICFIASGNTGVFNGHPAAMKTFAYGMQILNDALQRAGGPPNLVCGIRTPTIETGQALFHHPKVRLLLVTGGPGVVLEAMKAPKRAICAGPGNPPVVVDETADLQRAAASIIEGGGFDNNVLCIGEKQIFVVDSVADDLLSQFVDQGAFKMDANQVDQLTRVAFGLDKGTKPTLNRNLVGRDASVLARAAGVEVGYDPPILVGETKFDHPFVQTEQMMPFIPVVRVRDVTEGIDLAIESEHGYGHTATIHSRNIQNMHEMACRVNTTIFVKNGPSTAALGSGGEGYTSFSIAGPTGEGVTTARTFTRMRRCSLVDYFRIV